MARAVPLAQAATDLVFGSTCAGCGALGAAACDRCRGELLRRPRAVRPTPCPAGLPPVVAGAAYADPARALLLAHKERGRLSLAVPLGRALAGAAAMALSGDASVGPRVLERPVALVPVPSRPGTARRRGHDPLLRIARAAAAALRADGIDARVTPALRLARRVADQAGLSAPQRAANLADAMAVRAALVPQLRTRRVLLVDDVLTTGATLTEAARALRRAGAAPSAAAVVAATVRSGRN